MMSIWDGTRPRRRTALKNVSVYSLVIGVAETLGKFLQLLIPLLEFLWIIRRIAAFDEE